MLLVQQFRQALPSLTSPQTKGHSHTQLVFNRAIHFKLMHPKRVHPKEVCHIERADTEQTLYRILRCANGFKLLGKHGEEAYRLTRNTTKRTMNIYDSGRDDVVLSIRQKGQFFPIFQVFNGDGFNGKPFIEICASSEYNVIEMATGRIFAGVEQTNRWSELPSCSVRVDSGLNAPLLLLLVTAINKLVEL